ncbi:MAG: chorismate synthase [Bacteroidales bacterium]
MAGNTIGRMFRVTTYGESHGVAAGGIIDGCPAGLKIDMEKIRYDLSRRSASGDTFSTSRIEEDDARFLSGMFEGITTGAPIAFIVMNKNHDSSEYKGLKNLYRPGHGDYSWHMKYGHYDYRGGGRYSARETVARVVAGSIARQFLTHSGIAINGWVSAIGQQTLPGYGPFTAEQIEASPVRCPDANLTQNMLIEIDEAVAEGDTLGGIVSATITGVKPGLGEPVFDKIEAELAKAMLSIPSVKAFEMGEGFRATTMKGSEHNDTFTFGEDQKITTLTNHAGGTLGGISSGTPISFRVGFKPVSSIRKAQPTVTHRGDKGEVNLAAGRHDVCVVPRAVPIVEAMAAIVMADLLLRNRCSKR